MARAHVYRPITDDAGNLLYGATVAVQGDGGVPLGQALYADGTSGSTLPNPYIAASGIVDIWLETPQRLLVTEVSKRDPGRRSAYAEIRSRSTSFTCFRHSRSMPAASCT